LDTVKCSALFHNAYNILFNDMVSFRVQNDSQYGKVCDLLFQLCLINMYGQKNSKIMYDHAIETNRWSRYIAPLIRHVAAKWRRVTVTLRLLYLREIIPMRINP
jgi:hypothetical protein